MTSTPHPTKLYFHLHDSIHVEDRQDSSRTQPVPEEVPIERPRRVPEGSIPRNENVRKKLDSQDARYNVHQDRSPGSSPSDGRPLPTYHVARSSQPTRARFETPPRSFEEDEYPGHIKTESPNEDRIFNSPFVNSTPTRSRFLPNDINFSPSLRSPLAHKSKTDLTGVSRLLSAPLYPRDDHSRSASPSDSIPEHSRRGIKSVKKKPPVLTPKQHLIIATHTRTAGKWRGTYVDDIRKLFKEIESDDGHMTGEPAVDPSRNDPSNNKKSLNEMIRQYWRVWWMLDDEEVAARLKRWNLELPPKVAESTVKTSRREARERLNVAKEQWKKGEEDSTTNQKKVVIKKEEPGDD